MGEPRKRYAVRLTKATGENEAVEITFAADDVGDLDRVLGKLGDVVQRRVEAHNQRVVKVSEAVQAKVAEIRAQLRKEIAEEQRIEREMGLTVVPNLERREETDGVADRPPDVRPDP